MCEECNWILYLEDIDDLLENPEYKFAWDLLSGIRDWIEDNKHITEKQITAIENIAMSK